MSKHDDTNAKASDRRDSPERQRAAAQRRSNLHLRDTNLESKGDLLTPIQVASHAVSQAMAELHWRSSFAKEIDFSKPTQRGLPSFNSDGQKMYILGAEFAITAIVAAVAIARRRADLSSATLPIVADPQEAQDKHFSMVKIILSGEERSPSFDQGGLAKPGTVSGATAGEKRGVNTGDGKTDDAKTRDSNNPTTEPRPAALQNDYLYGSSKSRPRIIITLSDTLVSIAERHFHDGNVGWLIADLNSSKIRESFEDKKRIVEIANGESLELPIWKEIVAFYQRKPISANADNLVTIVTRRNIDKEIVEAILAPVINPDER